MRPAANLGEAGASEHAGGGDWVDAITSGGNHGSEAGGKEESGGGSGGDGGGGGVGGDPEPGVIERKNESSFKISKISEMSIMLTAQTFAAVISST